MFEQLRKSKLLFWSVELLVLAELLYLCTKISFVFAPLGTFFSTLFGPILAAGLLFYLFNPLIKQLGKFKISRNWAIAIVFLVFFGSLVVIIAMVIPNLVKQITQLVSALPDFAIKLQETGDKWVHSDLFEKIDFNQYWNQLDIKPAKIAEKVMQNFTTGLGSFISTATSITIGVFTVPMMLFYMLKDGDRLIPSVQKMMPSRYNQEVADLLGKMSNTISAYISGQALECLFVGMGTFIGYLIIGLPYAFLFGFIAGVTNIIPYIGPYIGIAPALFVALTISIPKTILVIVVVVAIQQIDANFVYPNIIGRSLDIHPLTIIVILLVAGNIAGVVGMILAIPFYAVVKTVIIYVHGIYQLKKRVS